MRKVCETEWENYEEGMWVGSESLYEDLWAVWELMRKVYATGWGNSWERYVGRAVGGTHREGVWIGMVGAPLRKVCGTGWETHEENNTWAGWWGNS